MENTGTPIFQDHVRRLETTDPKHPDTWNPNYQTLINNDVYLKTAVEELATTTDERLENIEAVVGDISITSAASVQQAVDLDWLYRGNRIAFEMWRPGYTLIDTIDVALVQGVNGDDSIDVTP